MPCSASAPKADMTCGKPMMTMRASNPAIRTPMVVTVSTIHLYFKQHALTYYVKQLFCDMFVLNFAASKKEKPETGLN
jgi:hypothetical protein